MKVLPLCNSQQTTLLQPVSLHGIGVHSGKEVSVTLLPADVNTGIVVQRQDSMSEISVNWTKVTSTALCTVLGDPGNGGIATVEHLMAALRGLNIDNALVEADSAEVPIMDGSSSAFVDAIDEAGIKVQSAERQYIRILKPVRVELDDRFSELRPSDVSQFDITIDFDSPIIGKQNFKFDLTPDAFRLELARARTFGFISDANSNWAKGLQRGASLENSVVIDNDNILNPEGIRWPDEFVRHKALDAVGDLALAGMPIVGLYRSHKGGHRLNHEILKKLFDSSSAYEIVRPSTGWKSSDLGLKTGVSAVAAG